MYLLGYDIGSSSIKAALVDAATQRVVALDQYPEQEMDMISRQRGWAEQQPEVWWQNVCTLTRRLLSKTAVAPTDIKGIGIGYQMHGLVLIDRDQQVLRPSIIWCDSRAVPIGDQAFQQIGEDYCMDCLLNSPGNFTASRLKWVKDNEPDIYEKAHKCLLPGDYIAMKFSGEAVTTISGLTEGIFWNFRERAIDRELLDHFELRKDLLPPTVPTFSIQGRVSTAAAELTGLAPGTPITYRAGDQPNNALALNVLHPGEVAATSGTSGVVYGIVDRPLSDQQSRVNAFAHVNYEQAFDRIGILLCLNGAGIEYSWIKHQVARGNHSYTDMERMASTVPIGADGLCMLPFGNGAERMLNNRHLNAHLLNLDFNRHHRAHVYRAALEGVAFSFVHGVNLLQELGINVDVIRVGNDNMFQSKIFSGTIATLLGSRIEVMETTGAIGAAQAAGVAAGAFASLDEALGQAEPLAVFGPELNTAHCRQAYQYWQSRLQLMAEERRLQEQEEIDAQQRIQELQRETRRHQRTIAQAHRQLLESNQLLQDLRSQLREKPGDAGLHRLLQKVSDHLEEADLQSTAEQSLLDLHEPMVSELSKRHPDLSRQDLMLCVLLRMKLSTKEVAQRLNLSVRGAETSRYRLRKKLALPKGSSLSTYLGQDLFA